MLTAFLQEAFGRLIKGAPDAPVVEGKWGACGDTLSQAVEHVVDETYSRLRLLPAYGQRLAGPVSTAFRHVDTLVEQIPEAIPCQRSAYVSDTRVNAFFSSPQQIQQVFSESSDVRALFDAQPDTDRCWALLCMRKEEHTRFGMALNGGEIRKDVLQTGVSFTDHQVLSPGCNEADARKALKCCIFNSLLSYIRRRARTSRETSLDLENRRRVLGGRLRLAKDEEEAMRLEDEIQRVEQELSDQTLRLHTLEDQLGFVSGVLSDPAEYVRREGYDMWLDRMGVKQDGRDDAGLNVNLSEIHVACHEPRIAALVCFPKNELLPRQDYLHKADLFLAV